MKRQLPWAALVFVLVVPPISADDTAKAKADDKSIQGTWIPATAELGGKPFPEQVLKTMQLLITDGKYILTIGDQTDQGTVKLDPANDPKAMDIIGTKGPNQGKTFLAIYKLTDNTLRICYDLRGKARPKEFSSKGGAQLFLVEYKRQ